MGFEFQKCCSKVWKPLLLLLALNAAVCIWVTRADPRFLTEDGIAEFFDLYTKNAMQMDEEYRLGVSRSVQESKYAPEGFSDWQMFREIYSRIEYIEEFGGQLQNVLDRTQDRLAGSSGYSQKYYENVIRLYGHVKDDAVLGLEYSRGWMSYFSYRAGDFLLLVLIVYLSSTLFTHERISGFLPILRSTKNGRTKTAVAKLCVLTVMVTAIFLLFTTETWLIFWFRTGFSSIRNGIQIFISLQLCPYVITVGQFFLLSIIIRLCAFIVFSLIASLISVSLYHPVAEFVANTVVVGSSYLLYMTRSVSPDGLLANIGLFPSLEVIPLFARYRAADFFGYPVSYLTILALVFILSVLVLLSAIILKYKIGISMLPESWLSRISASTGVFRKSLEGVVPHARYERLPSLFAAEVYKTLFLRHALLCIAILFVSKLFLSAAAYKPPVSYSDAVYKEYMQILAGEATDEKRMYISEERNRINETLQNFEDLQKQYIDGAMSVEEYQEILSEYNTAYSRDIYLARVENHLIYIDTQKEEGREAWFVYDTGWNKLFFQGYDWTLFFALLIPFCGAFASEYNGTSSSYGFAGILKTTKNGRRKTMTSKHMSVVCLSVVWIVIWTVSDCFFLVKAYDMPLPSSPIASLETMAGVIPSLTLWQYALLMFVVRALVWIVFAVLVCSMSQILKKQIPVLSVAAIFTLIPDLLIYFGLTALRNWTFVSLVKVTPMLITNVPILLYLGVFVFVVSASTYYAGKTWVK